MKNETVSAASSTAQERYSVVVESGSCSTDRRYWEEKINCGHAHRTIEAAMACKTKLTRWHCNHGRIAGTPCGCGRHWDDTHNT